MSIDGLEFFQAMAMIAADRPKMGVNGIFFHGRSFHGDDDGLFELARTLIPSTSSRVVVVNGGNGEGCISGTLAWPGCATYTQKLRNLKCNAVASAPAKHTLEEGFAFSEFAEETGWTRAIVIAQPFQLVRIMLTHLHVMLKRDYRMQIYAAAPTSVCWTKVTSGNQGQAGMVRFDQIKAEFDRIRTYQAQGNLATFPQLFEYMLRGR